MKRGNPAMRQHEMKESAPKERKEESAAKMPKKKGRKCA